MSGTASARGESNQALAPLREKVFRRIWLASVLSSLGQLIFGVAVSWEMTRLSDTPTLIALVQTAMMAPLMIVTLPAGALADMFDRRKIAMSGLGISTFGAGALAIAGFFGLLSPWILLATCVVVGMGTSIYLPAWQSSIAEQVSRENLPAAVGLSSLSANVARSFGPALGGFIILIAGSKTAFALSAGFFIPLLLAYYLWERQHVPSRLAPERIDRAIASGARYAYHSPVIRTVLVRTLVFAFIVAPGPALAPLVAKEMLRGDALVLGTLLGAQGIGAVVAALFVDRIRQIFKTETAVRLLALGAGLSLAAIAFSQTIALTTIAFFVFGGCYITTLATLNVDIQLSASRWVVARALSLFSSATFIGLGVGAWVWGMVAEAHGTAQAFAGAGIAAIASIGLGYILPLRKPASQDQNGANIEAHLAVNLDINIRSGPIVIDIVYNVDPKDAREFYAAILQLQPVRHRIGAYNWSIARNIADPAIWTERYQCSTWGDYLRMLDRYSEGDMVKQAQADAYHRPGNTPRTTRRLERPFGSVRWRADSFDPKEELVSYF